MLQAEVGDTDGRQRTLTGDQIYVWSATDTRWVRASSPLATIFGAAGLGDGDVAQSDEGPIYVWSATSGHWERETTSAPTYASLISTAWGLAEGDAVEVSQGALYCWSQILRDAGASIEESTIRAEAYDLSGAGIAVRARIVGDVVPSSEDPAWTDAVTGGTISAAGGVVIHDTSGANNRLAKSTLTHAAEAKPWSVAGSFRIRSHAVGCVGGANAHTFQLLTAAVGGKHVVLNLHYHTATAPRLTSSADAVLGSASGGPDLTAAAHHLTLIVDPAGDVTLYADHAAAPFQTAAYALFSAHTALELRLGDIVATVDVGQLAIDTSGLVAVSLT